MADLSPPPEVAAVIVHAPRLSPLGGEAAFSVLQIGPRELAAETRTDAALKAAPGVSLFRRTDSGAANPTTQGLSLRSIAPSGAGRALVTLDGAPQNDPFGGWVIWSALPPEGLDGATIVRGAGAGPYGAGALTGVVALQERPAEPGLAAIELSGGSRDSLRAAAVVGGPGLLVTAAASTTGGYYAVRGAQRGPADERLSRDDGAFAVRLQRDIGEVQTAVRLSAYDVRQNAGLAGARSIASGAQLSVTLARPAREGVGGWRLQGWVIGSNLENSSVAVAARRAGTTAANDQYATPATGYGLNAALQGRAGVLSWELGTDVRLADGTDRERFRVVNGVFTRDREAGGKTLVGGVYLETAAETGPWTLAAGARVDRAKAYDAVRRERDTATGALVLNQSTPGRADTIPTARAGVRYAFDDSLYLRAAAYVGFRPPTLNELHRPFRVGNDVTEANPGLKPERLQGVEGGVGGGGAVSWQATLFYNRLQDPITNVTVGVGPATFPTAGFIPAGGTLRQRQNAGEIEAWGVEADAAGDLATQLSWRSALDYTHAVVHGGASAPQLSGLRPAQTPRWTVTGGLEWRPAERLRLSADLRWESARFEDDLNTRRLAAGLDLDLRAGWRLGPAEEVYVAVENATDAKLQTGQTADGVLSLAEPVAVRVGFSLRR